jgi:hypothetical protein
MLIETNPPSGPSPQPIARGIRPRSAARAILLWAGGVLLILLSGAFAPVPGYVLIIAVCLVLGWGLGRLVPDASGLRDHHQ